MEFNDLLGEGDFLDSYNKPSEVKGRVMQPKVRDDGYYFKLKELEQNMTLYVKISAKWS